MHKRTRQQVERKRRIAALQATPPPIDHPLSSADIAKLQKQLYGPIVLPTDPTYDLCRQLSNQAYQDFPQVIVYCTVISDVRACLDFAQKHNVWVVMRSGGHSTACYSMNSGMVIDLSKMCYANVDTRQKRVAVGAGTPFGFLNNVLHEYGLHVPTGACSDV